ncbi:MAG: ABC transporter permease [Thermoplasmata archaeon]|nr:ABC transporter permease [Thermoplasmata archaeon]
MNQKHLSTYLSPLFFIILFFILWEIFADYGIVDSALFSKPSRIFCNIYNNSYLVLIHLSTTLYRLILSFIVAVGFGILSGIIMGANRFVYRFFDPLLTVLMCIPGIAMVPVFIVLLGFGDSTILTIGIIVAFFPIVYNVSTGVRSVDKNLVNAARIMGGDRKTIFLKVYLPSSTPYLVTGLKLGLARCWRTIIAVEFIAATNFGFGYMIWDAYEYLDVTTVYGGIILLGIIFYTIEKTLIREIEKKTIEKWGVVSKHEW